MQLYFRKALGGFLEPWDEEALEAMKKVKAGTVLRVEVKRPRNPLHHRKFMALVQLIQESSDRYNSVEDVLVAIKLRTGWYREHVTANGELVYVPKSIAFDAMDQTKFEQFYSQAIDAALDMVPGMVRLDMEQAIDRIMAFA